MSLGKIVHTAFLTATYGLCFSAGIIGTDAYSRHQQNVASERALLRVYEQLQAEQRRQITDYEYDPMNRKR